jgi:hypothetical protein
MPPTTVQGEASADSFEALLGEVQTIRKMMEKGNPGAV